MVNNPFSALPQNNQETTVSPVKATPSFYDNLQTRFNQTLDDVSKAKTSPPPKLEKISKAPNLNQNGYNTSEFGKFALLAFAFSSMAALGTRDPLVAGADALAGALKGYRLGNEKIANNKMAEFKANMEAAERNNTDMMRKYQTVIENKKLTLYQKQVELTALARMMHDVTGAKLAEQKNYTGFLEYEEKMQQGFAKLKLMAESIGQKGGLIKSQIYKNEQEGLLAQANSNLKKIMALNDPAKTQAYIDYLKSKGLSYENGNFVSGNNAAQNSPNNLTMPNFK